MATQAQIQDLAEKMQQERASLLTMFEGISEECAETRPPDADGEEGWSVKGQLSHLVWMGTAYHHWVQRAFTEDRLDLSEGDHPDPVAYPMEQAHDRETRRQVEAVARVHAGGGGDDRAERLRAHNGLTRIRRADGDAVAPLLLPTRPYAQGPDRRQAIRLPAAVPERRRDRPTLP